MTTCKETNQLSQVISSKWYIPFSAWLRVEIKWLIGKIRFLWKERILMDSNSKDDIKVMPTVRNWKTLVYMGGILPTHVTSPADVWGKAGKGAAGIVSWITEIKRQFDGGSRRPVDDSVVEGPVIEKNFRKRLVIHYWNVTSIARPECSEDKLRDIRNMLKLGPVILAETHTTAGSINEIRRRLPLCELVNIPPLPNPKAAAGDEV